MSAECTVYTKTRTNSLVIQVAKQTIAMPPYLNTDRFGLEHESRNVTEVSTPRASKQPYSYIYLHTHAP